MNENTDENPGKDEQPPSARWRRVRLFLWEDRDRRSPYPEPIVLELSGRIDRSRVIWSYTLGRLWDEDFIPTTHLSARNTRAYVVLLETASREVTTLQAALREQHAEAPHLPEAQTITVRSR